MPWNRTWIVCWLSLSLLCADVTSDPADVWTTRDLSGVEHQIPRDQKSKATVLLFLQPDCPISNQYAPTLNRLHRSLSRKGVRFFLVYPDQELTAKEVGRHVESFQLTMPALLDSKHTLVNMTGVTITPEAVVFDGRGHQIYRGRINNRYIDFGKKRPRATRQDLQLAVEAVLQGQSPETAVTPAVGCFIDRDVLK